MRSSLCASTSHHITHELWDVCVEGETIRHLTFREETICPFIINWCDMISLSPNEVSVTCFWFKNNLNCRITKFAADRKDYKKLTSYWSKILLNITIQFYINIFHFCHIVNMSSRDFLLIIIIIVIIRLFYYESLGNGTFVLCCLFLSQIKMELSPVLTLCQLSTFYVCPTTLEDRSGSRSLSSCWRRFRTDWPGFP